jgi:hypothetical protein
VETGQIALPSAYDGVDAVKQGLRTLDKKFLDIALTLDGAFVDLVTALPFDWEPEAS